MGKIYKITNDVNEKIYIGKTVTSLEERWAKHLSAAKNGNTHLYRAMRKYGVEHFNISIIEDNISDEYLNEREIYWISYYDSMHTGYNSTIGGDGRKWIEREEVAFLYQEGLSITEIADLLGVWSCSIVDVLKELSLYDANEIQKRKSLYNSLLQSQNKIMQYTGDLTLVATYNSIQEAAQKNNYNANSIKTAIYTQIGYKGYFWVQERHKLPSARNIKMCNSKKIMQFDINNNYIQTFNSATEAAKSVNGDASGIIKVCKGTRKTYHKYIWRYEE